MNLARLAKQLEKLDVKQVEEILAEVSEKVEVQNRLRQLREEREQLLRRLRNIETEIAKLEGHRRPQRRGKRGRSQPTLAQRAKEVLAKFPTGLRISDLAVRIREAGHHTLSKPRTFVTAVYLAIKRDPRFHRLSKGIYALRRRALRGNKPAEQAS